MSRSLTITNKLLSLRGRMLIGDGEGRERYEARGQFSLLSPTWRLLRDGELLGSVRKRLLAWRPTWDVRIGNEHFVIDRKLLALRRIHRVHGGRFDGATLTGNFWDFTFQVEHHGRELARARGKLLTLRDTHSIELASDAAEDELFVVMGMIVVLLDRKDNSSNHAPKS